jgi:hypothetical protein
MDAGIVLPTCLLRLIGADATSPLIQQATEELWRLKHEEVEIHRHSSVPEVTHSNASEVWLIANASLTETKRKTTTAYANRVCLFLCERTCSDPLPDLRHFAAADWIFHPWAEGELVLRIRALLTRVHPTYENGHQAFYHAGSESATFPLKRAKAEMVSAFERGYLVSLMQTHAGNVSGAARAARKHRRAFLALLRKHRIEAGLFRKIENKPQLPLKKTAVIRRVRKPALNVGPLH